RPTRSGRRRTTTSATSRRWVARRARSSSPRADGYGLPPTSLPPAHEVVSMLGRSTTRGGFVSTVETAVGRIGWHELLTKDVEKAKSFYTELCGWGIETFKPGEVGYEMISADGKTHGGFLSV